jgi:hypothetical protein
VEEGAPAPTAETSSTSLNRSCAQVKHLRRLFLSLFELIGTGLYNLAFQTKDLESFETSDQTSTSSDKPSAPQTDVRRDFATPEFFLPVLTTLSWPRAAAEIIHVVLD